MKQLHSLLQRQLRRMGVKKTTELPSKVQWQGLLKHVNRAYLDHDQYRYTIERSIDISSGELQHLYQRYQQTHSKLEAIISEGICFIDSNWIITSINAEAARLLAHTNKEIAGQHLSDVFYLYENLSSSTSISLSTLQKKLESGNPYYCDPGKIEMSNGKTLLAAFSLNPLIQDNTFAGVVMLFRDIREKVISEKKLRAVIKKAEKSNKAKSQFLANMSHEVRTPLNGIMGMSEVLLNTDLNSKQTGILHTIIKSGDDLLGIINSILDLSKVESGKFELENQHFDLFKIIDSTLALFISQAHRKNIHLQSNIADNCPQYLFGDSLRIKQVLNNLIGNAIKFTEKGSVIVSIKPRHLHKQNALLSFSVQDTGIGIAKKFQKKIFDPFVQADTTTTRRFGGTGLGLSITKSLCRLMNGSISLKSKLHKGTQINFYIPLTISSEKMCLDDDTLSTKTHFIKTISKQYPAKLLLVEDNLVNQDVAKKMLEILGSQVTIANNGQEAIDILKIKKFDLIFMDCQMPIMDGYAATIEIRKTEKNGQRTPIIALTAHAISSDSDLCSQCGMDDYLCKPYKIHDIEMKFKKWIPHIQKKPPLTPGIINIAMLEDINNMSDINDPDMLDTVIKSFLQTSPDYIEKIKKGIRKKEISTIKIAAHTFKSSSATLGAVKLSKTCAKLETLPEQEMLSKASSILSRIEIEYREFKKALLSAKQYFQGDL